MMKQELISRLRAFEKNFIPKKEETEKALKTNLKRLEERLLEAQAADIWSETISMYKASLASLESIYQELSEAQKGKRGISFFIENYIKNCQEPIIPKGKAEEFFDDMIAPCCDAVKKICESQSVEEDVEPQKEFCQYLTNVRYIVRNAETLLKDSEKDKILRQNLCDPIHQEIAKVKDKIKERITPLSLGAEYEEEYKKLKKDIDLDIFHKKPFSLPLHLPSVSDYCFTLGIKPSKEKLTPSDLSFLNTYMGVPKDFENLLNGEAVTFCPKSDETFASVILVKATSKFFKSKEFESFLIDLYLAFYSKMPLNELKLNVCDTTLSKPAKKIANRIKTVSEKLINGCTDNENEVCQHIKNLLEHHSNVMSESIPNDTTFLCYFIGDEIWEYWSREPKSKEFLQECGAGGIIPVFFDMTDQSSHPALEEIPHVCIEKADEGWYYNGTPFQPCVAAEQFDPSRFTAILEETLKEPSVLSPKDVWISASKESEGKPKEPFYQNIRIPIGYKYTNGQKECPYFLQFTPNKISASGFILGESGTGKSSFLHTLILSAAYHYPPDELQFYLADFKDKNGGSEFIHYEQMPGKENLYIPHVRYLLKNCTKESTLGLFQMVLQLFSDRSRIIKESGCPDFTDYHRKRAKEIAEKKTTSMKKLPFAVFLIDETKSMFDGLEENASNDSDDYWFKSKLEKKIQFLYSKIRTAGIAIIFSCQNKRPINAISENTELRISLRSANAEDEKEWFGVEYNNAESKKIADWLAPTGKYPTGKAIYNEGKTGYSLVKNSFAGQTNGEEQRKLAEEIREKWKDVDTEPQIQAASEDLFPIGEAKKLLRGEEIFSLQDLNAEEIKRKTKYYLPIGVSVGASLKMSIPFSNDAASLNFFALGSKHRMLRLEQNAIFAFLKNHCEESAGKDKPEIYYCICEEGMAPDEVQKAVWNPNVKILSDKAEICYKICELNDSIGVRDSESPPILFVFHGIEWLMKEDAYTTFRLADRAEFMPAADDDEPIDIDVLYGDDPNLKDMIKSFNSEELKKKKSAFDSSVPKAKDVKNALARLQEEGNQKNIFCLLTALNPYYATELCNLMTGNNGERALKNHMIYPCLSAVKATDFLEHDNNVSSTVLFANEKNAVVVRLFDCAGDKSINASWWDELKTQMKKG